MAMIVMCVGNANNADNTNTLVVALSSMFQMNAVFFCLFLVVTTNAVDCLERLISEMTYYANVCQVRY